jgi:hypothetical protein
MGEAKHKDNNNLKPLEVTLNLRGKVIGVRLPPHVCAKALGPGTGYDPTDCE